MSDYGQVRIKADLSTDYITDIPTVQDWTLTYYYREYAAQEPAVTGFGSEE